jgi:glycosyltransferase involved in cell wall biosynthesis
MRIGIMLRSWDEKGGIGLYTRNIVKELLDIDRKNHYFLYFNNTSNSGLFTNYENVKEFIIPGKSKILWDQVYIPIACKQNKIEVLFHPKFTLPMLAPCKSVMTVHGADWFMPDQAVYYTKLDLAYIRAVMPLYFKKAAKVISVSKLTADNFIQSLNIPENKIETIYLAAARHFRRVCDETVFVRVKDKYKLPDKFILTLTKRMGDKRKNLPQILQAYQHYHAACSNPHKLIIGGKDCHLYRKEYNIPNDSYGADILFPGWIDQEDLPAVYSMADLFLYPSNLEAFPVPITEAMACGTPIITSDVNGLREIAGDVALFIDPNNTVDISNSIKQVLEDNTLRAELSKKGLARSNLFTWETCAKNTLNLLEDVGLL